MTQHNALAQLAALYGIAAEYHDIWGNLHPTGEATQRALLTAMGVNLNGDVTAIFAGHATRSWRRMLPPVQVVRVTDGAPAVPVVYPAARTKDIYRWTLAHEDSSHEDGVFHPAELEHTGNQLLDGEEYERGLLRLPVCPPGYHRLTVQAADGSETGMTLIVAPATAYQPPALAGDGRIYGPALQLYGVRSLHNWGIGDFTDLRMVLELAGESGMDIVGLNPLHALFPDNPAHASPYSPSSRLFLDILYLDVEAVADFAECDEACTMVADEAFQARLRALRSEELVDYQQVMAVKQTLLAVLYRHFREWHLQGNSERGQQFRDFQLQGGENLRRHALFETLQAYFRKQDAGIHGWPAWPAAFHDPAASAVADFMQEHIEQVEYYEYLQWLADQQLDMAGKTSLAYGLGVGLYGDLAVGVDRGGAETWACQPCHALGASIGAPADDFNPDGQDWSLSPWIPEQLREAAYAPFIAILRANMRHTGALRIDHVMGLMRLFWNPRDPAVAGTYVNYPFDDLLGILMLESQRNRCLVIGEDLGTVPDSLRERMQQAGILSYRVLLFSHDEQGGFLAPAAYPAQSLVTVSTHDLPTLRGYWQGQDIDTRASLGLFADENVRQQQVMSRASDRAALLIALEREALLEGGSMHPVANPEMSLELMCAVHRFLARTQSQIMMIHPGDIFGQLEQINLPGATNEAYPNWQRRLSVNLEEWRDDPRLQRIVGAVLAERAGAKQAHPSQPAQGDMLQARSPRIPLCTYRLQFNRDFTFNQAREIVPYLHALGVSHLYASPYLKARPGSTHGYDIIDHNTLNPEIGTYQEFELLCATLAEHGMGQVLDVVPNHMGVGGDNAWWLDVLENGQASAYAKFFDIDWAPIKPELRGKVLLPVLGNRYGVVLDNAELQLRFDVERGEFAIYYYEHHFPIDSAEYPLILTYRMDVLSMRLGEEAPLLQEFQSLATAFRNLPSRNDASPERQAERRRDKEVHKHHLASLVKAYPDIAWFLDENLRIFNGVAGDAASFDLLHQLIEAQAYRLAYWRVASDEINYRRFFDINDLAGLRMENDEVFDATHQLLLRLVGEGKLDGLRLDHPDGLYDPEAYFRKLVEQCRLTGCAPYLVVEKILAVHEKLRSSWPVHGTTGYEFTNLLNGLFVDTSAAKRMERVYNGFICEHVDFDDLLYHSKKLIMKTALSGELNVLANLLSKIAEADRHTCDYTLNGLRRALAEIIACFPVYRGYISAREVTAEDRHNVEQATLAAKRRSTVAETGIFDFLQDVLTLAAADGKSAAYHEQVLIFAMKFQQITSPVMAKGLEDTSAYIYHRLLSLNEVGGDPRQFGVTRTVFHRANAARARDWPHAMLATSTHDTKRSEDVRARLNVLSEMPAAWRLALRHWSRANRSLRREVDGVRVPTPNDEYFIYQTLLGIWPQGEPDAGEMAQFLSRLKTYLIKSVREAKVHTSWINPDTAYEEAILAFADALVNAPAEGAFKARFMPFQRRIARLGLFNSLSQTLLKLTVPGVPDIYQGCELWDFSLVDPDNRRPVDFNRRRAMLDELQTLATRPPQQRSAGIAALCDALEDGRAKLLVVSTALALRNRWPEVFDHGEYLPLTIKGERAAHLCAYARMAGGRIVITIVSRYFARLLGENERFDADGAIWGDTTVALPFHRRNLHYACAFTGNLLKPQQRRSGWSLRIADVLAAFPLGLVVADDGQPEIAADSKYRRM